MMETYSIGPVSHCDIRRIYESGYSAQFERDNPFLRVVAKDQDGKEAGNADFEIIPGKGVRIDNIVTLPIHQRQGIGTAMCLVAREVAGPDLINTQMATEDGRKLIERVLELQNPDRLG